MKLYREEILDHYKHPRNWGSLKRPTHEARGANASCGDMLEVQLRIEKDRIEEIAFRGVGCALSVAGASILSEVVEGKKPADIEKMDEKFIEKLVGEVNPGRKKCVILGLSTIKQALDGKIKK